MIFGGFSKVQMCRITCLCVNVVGETEVGLPQIIVEKQRAVFVCVRAGGLHNDKLVSAIRRLSTRLVSPRVPT